MSMLANDTKRAPAFFIGHGSPMNAIEQNAFTNSLGELGKSIEKQKLFWLYLHIGVFLTPL